MRKKVLAISMVILLMLSVTGCSKYKYDEGCWWDHQRPTMRVINNDSEAVYICEECASDCMYCHGKASKFVFNLLGGPIAVCDDCYNK